VVDRPTSVLRRRLRGVVSIAIAACAGAAAALATAPDRTARVAGATAATTAATHTADTYPAGADVKELVPKGEPVGPLEDLRVPGKYTVFDFYADWCGPCKGVDMQLRELLARRTDVAVRRLDVVSFESPLARELGYRLKALPYVVVFTPDGKRTDIVGGNRKRLSAALADAR
jgi:thiol-disulfide isomerase/thioredoxin